MSIKGRIAKWNYWRKMARIDRECAKRGHQDSGCYSVTGSHGVCCGRCGRILWTSEHGGRLNPPRYQAPSRAVDSNWR